jgi:hypothetical protein
MALNSRTKGQTGEREIADLLNAIVFRATTRVGDFKRNLQQTQDGGFDLFSVEYPFFAVEVKRVEALTPAVVDGFWAQAKRQATKDTSRNALLPVLIYRKNRQPWRVRTYGSLVWSTEQIVVDVSWDAFAPWFQKQIETVNAKRNS